MCRSLDNVSFQVHLPWVILDFHYMSIESILRSFHIQFLHKVHACKNSLNTKKVGLGANNLSIFCDDKPKENSR